MPVVDLKPNSIVRGSILPEPIKLISITQLGDSVKLIGEGLTTGKVHKPILTAEQIATLEISPEKEPFDGDASRFRLGIEAMRLGLAYEYDPYFSLSIARVDPLPRTRRRTSSGSPSAAARRARGSSCAPCRVRRSRI